MIVATIRRENGKYRIHYSEPIWPDKSKSMDDNVQMLMSKGLERLEKSIAKNPSQWLWQHNRWKQETPKIVYYRYRYDSILVILKTLEDLKSLKTFRKIYPKAFLTILAPKSLCQGISIPEAEVIAYDSPQDILLDDYRFKLVFDLTNTNAVKNHYASRSAFKILTKTALLKTDPDLSNALKKVLCRAP